MESKGKIGIVGSGLIGKSWAMIFASVGYKVSIERMLRSYLWKFIPLYKNENIVFRHPL
jgi:hypothetical protein